MTFTVDHEQLRGHAGTLAGYADQLAATGTRLPDQVGKDSLGEFAQFLTAGLGTAMGETLQAFQHVATTIDKVSTGVRHVADTYQRTDDTNASGLTQAGA